MPARDKQDRTREEGDERRKTENVGGVQCTTQRIQQVSYKNPVIFDILYQICRLHHIVTYSV